MQQYFRMVLWVFCLLTFSEHLQANPVVCPSLHVRRLDKVECGHNVTFISPTNVQNHCLTAALKHFKEGLDYAACNCRDDDDDERINDTVKALNNCCQKIQFSQHPQTNSAECKWEDEGSRKQFAEFVNNFKDFIKLLMSNATPRTAKD